VPNAIKLIRIAMLFVLLVGAGTATAGQKLFSLNATARRWIGNAPLTVPVGGPAQGTDGLIGQITTGVGPPPTLQIWDAQLNKVASPATSGIFDGLLTTGNALQLKTSLNVQLPPVGAFVTMKAGGRSGPPTFNFCPGANDPSLPGTDPAAEVFQGTATPWNPNCTVPGSTNQNGAGIVHGTIRYMATSNQFGGLGALAVQGTFSLAALFAPPTVPTPTTSSGFGNVLFAQNTISGSGVGAPIGSPPSPAAWQNAPVFKKLFYFTTGGLLTHPTNPSIPAVGGIIPIPLPTPSGTSWSGPLTTGKVTVRNTTNTNSTFMMQGYDTRTPSGIGNIQLVSGAITQNTVTGPSTQRSQITLSITPEPTMLAGAGVAFIALIGAHQVTRRRRQNGA